MAADPAISAAATLRRSGRVAEAAALLRRAVARPGAANDGELNLHLGDALLALGHAEQARFYFERAASVMPASALPHVMVGNALMAAGKAAEAEPHYRRGLRVEPQLAAAHGLLGAALVILGRNDEAEDSLRAAIALGYRDPGAPIALANLLGKTGRVEEGLAILRDPALTPADDPVALAYEAYLSNCTSSMPPEQVLAVHRRFGAALTRKTLATAKPLPVPPLRSQGAPLRIGFLSPDLRDHAVACFLEPLLAHRDRARSEVACLSLRRQDDPVAQRLRSLADGWCDCHALDDSALAALIRRERIDVLVDLFGPTQYDRLGVVCLRPAALTVSAIGYPCSSGLDSIDLRLCDAITDPPAAAGSEPAMIEQPMRLDGCFLCYSPPSDAPTPSRASTESTFTFGSFNNLSKLSEATVSLWSRLLGTVPSSRLLLKSLVPPTERIVAHVRGRFAARGIAADRVQFLPPAPDRGSHLNAYAGIDVALDTFPYNGTTTTCEALWMGVPVVTLLGRAHAGRVGASLLTAAGLREWIARDEDDYIAIASRLAADRAGLTSLRTGLRERIRRSTLCDGPNYAARFYMAVETAFAARRATA